MHIHTYKVEPRHVARRFTLRSIDNRIIVRNNRSHQWGLLFGCTLAISILAVFVQSQSRNSTVQGYFTIAALIGVPFALICLLVMARGWQVVFDADRRRCLVQKTYARITYKTIQMSLSDGPVGPCTVSIGDKTGADPVVETIGCLFLGLLGPIGILLIVLSRMGRHDSRSVEVTNKVVPTIFHYSEANGEPAVILAFENVADRDRVLQAFAGMTPEDVSTS